MLSYAYREHSQPPKVIQALRSRKLVLLLGAGLIAMLLVTFSNKGLLRRILLERELSEKDARISELTEDISVLQKTRDKLRFDKSVIEHVARESHGMIKPGELVYRIRPATSTPRR